MVDTFCGLGMIQAPHLSNTRLPNTALVWPNSMQYQPHKENIPISQLKPDREGAGLLVMPTKGFGKIYQLKVSLDSPPDCPIWRRLLIPCEFKLSQLHDVLQTAFGWQNSHLHEFRIGRRTFGRPDWEEDFMGQSPPEDERRVRLHRVLSAVGTKATYLYDFGDNWEHKILVEQLHPEAPGQRYPLCVDGWGQCPPEDCGGVPGYENLVRVMQNRYDPEYAEIRRWLGRKFDPDDFSVEPVNRKLAVLGRRRAECS